jgi:hypothetical protein
MSNIGEINLPGGIKPVVADRVRIYTGSFNNPTENTAAYLGMTLPISSANICQTGHMLNIPVKYTANTGLALINTANTNLDGSGTVATLITAASSGTLIRSITIKAQGSPSRGMIRIFFKAGASSWLLHEVPVEAVVQGSVDHSFVYIIDEPFFLKPGDILAVSTQNADTFLITADGLDITYPF